MAMQNKHLENIFFGTELEKLEIGTHGTFTTLKKSIPEFRNISAERFTHLVDVTKKFFSKRIIGRYGGSITAGDAFFMIAFMEAVKPEKMIEIGACSGVSSYFILYAAQELGLLVPSKKFLYSLDINVIFRSDPALKIGQVVGLNAPELLSHWSLHTEMTLPEMCQNNKELQEEIFSTNKLLAFVDANHSHPYPAIDCLLLNRLMPENSWGLFQDIQLTERWLANTIERDIPTPAPLRGVNFVVSHWPRNKTIGLGSCYNMGGIQFSLKNEELNSFIDKMHSYPPEEDENSFAEFFQSEKTPICDKKPSRFTTSKYKERKENRYWWWRLNEITYDPLLYHMLNEKEIAIFDNWYIDTDQNKYSGECCPPFISLIQGLIGGNGIQKIVQLGHFAGYSTLNIGFLLKKLNSGKLCSIDYNEKISNYTREWVEKAELTDYVKILVGDSASPEIVKKTLEYIEGPPQLLIIDSAHTYTHTLKELDIWMPELQKNGFILLHDASNAARKYDKENGGVAQALEEWCKKNQYPFFVINGGDATPGSTHSDLIYKDGRGVGIIQKIKL